jgi:hypothetical protein
MPVSEALRQRVRALDGDRCAYCRSPAMLSVATRTGPIPEITPWARAVADPRLLVENAHEVSFRDRRPRWGCQPKVSGTGLVAAYRLPQNCSAGQGMVSATWR